MKYDLTYIQPDLTPAQQKVWNLGLRPCTEKGKVRYWYTNDDDEHRQVHKRYPSQNLDVAMAEEQGLCTTEFVREKIERMK